MQYGCRIMSDIRKNEIRNVLPVFAEKIGEFSFLIKLFDLHVLHHGFLITDHGKIIVCGKFLIYFQVFINRLSRIPSCNLSVKLVSGKECRLQLIIILERHNLITLLSIECMVERKECRDHLSAPIAFRQKFPEDFSDCSLFPVFRQCRYGSYSACRYRLPIQIKLKFVVDYPCSKRSVICKGAPVFHRFAFNTLPLALHIINSVMKTIRRDQISIKSLTAINFPYFHRNSSCVS